MANKRWTRTPILICTLLVAGMVGLGVWAWRQNGNFATVPIWASYQKAPQSNQLARAVPTDPELAAVLGPSAVGKTRAPASTSPDFAVQDGRLVLDNASRALQQLPDIHEYLNSVNPEWEDLLAKDLLKHRDDGTKVYLNHEKSLLQVESGRGRYVEQVVVNYVRPDGRRSSFRALVDSDSGDVLRTWDRSMSEDYRREPLLLVPGR